jgi:hypothetical protein
LRTSSLSITTLVEAGFSKVNLPPCRWDIMLFEDINGQGSRLYLNAGRDPAV